MKKLVMVLLILFMALVSISAATDSATLQLNANVGAVVSVTLDASSSNAVLVGDGTGTTFVDRTVTVISNMKNWALSFTSTNAGYLLKAGLTPNIPYTIKATPDDTTGITNGLVSATQLTSAVNIVGANKTKKQGVIFTLAIAIPSQNATDELYEANAVGEFYTDTVTITITAS